MSKHRYGSSEFNRVDWDGLVQRLAGWAKRSVPIVHPPNLHVRQAGYGEDLAGAAGLEQVRHHRVRGGGKGGREFQLLQHFSRLGQGDVARQPQGLALAQHPDHAVEVAAGAFVTGIGSRDGHAFGFAHPTRLSSVLPFHGIAGSGSYEVAMVGALVPLGVSTEAALTGAVNLHLFLLGVTLFLGALALLLPVRRLTTHRLL